MSIKNNDGRFATNYNYMRNIIGQVPLYGHRRQPKKIHASTR